MGRDKAFLRFDGKPLIEHSLALARDIGASEVLISGRTGQDFSGQGCPVIVDAIPDRGPLGGIERALDAARYPLVLVLAVDLPHMTPVLLRWLCGSGREESRDRDAFHRGPTDGSAVGAVPLLHGQPEPLAAIYPGRAHELIRRMLMERRLSARGFSEACAQQGMVCALPVPLEHEACFANWNTPEDMA